MRRPIVAPIGDPLACGEIFTRIADALGLVPPIPDALVEAAQKDRFAFAVGWMTRARSDPDLMTAAPFVLAKTLGRAMGSSHLAALWGLLAAAPARLFDDAGRAGRLAANRAESIRSTVGRLPAIVGAAIRNRSLLPELGLHPRAGHGERLFRSVMDHPEGLWLGKSDPAANLSAVRTPSGRIELHIPEMEAWMADLTPEREAAALAPDPAFPLILMAGRHMRTNANTLMRDPAWNRGRRCGTLAMHAEDAAALGLADGQAVRVVTAGGEETTELEICPAARPGHVSLPHGFGLVYRDTTVGANVNRLTQAAHRDPFAGTPLHRYVPCRVEAA